MTGVVVRDSLSLRETRQVAGGMNLALGGKQALVSGGSRGIGRAIVLALARGGASVAACYHNESEAVTSLATELHHIGGDSQVIQADVADEASVAQLVRRVRERFGRIDILVNNAGLYSALKKKNFMEIDTDEWDRVMAVNVKGLFLCVKAVYPAMKQQKKGKIINISSGTTQSGTPLFLHYVSSKAGVLGFTRALAREVGGDNICVNSIMPGLTISSPNQEGVTSPEQLADRRKRRAIQRDQYPQDLVGTVIFLASDDSDFMTGQSIGVDGGMNMH